jgi:ESCRT-II complex subunit VPS22
VNICIALRPKNGGFLEENDCLRLLQQIRGSQSQEITIKDVRKAVESINKLGNDFKIITQGDKHSKRLICSVSVELDQDHMALLKAAEIS